MTFLKNEITKLCRKVLKWRFRGYASRENYMYQKPRILDLSDDGLTRFHYSDNGTQKYSQTFLKFMFISFLGNFIWILYGFHFFPKCYWTLSCVFSEMFYLRFALSKLLHIIFEVDEFLLSLPWIFITAQGCPGISASGRNMSLPCAFVPIFYNLTAHGVSGHICKRQEHVSSVRLCANFL